MDFPSGLSKDWRNKAGLSGVPASSAKAGRTSGGSKASSSKIDVAALGGLADDDSLAIGPPKSKSRTKNAGSEYKGVRDLSRSNDVSHISFFDHLWLL